MRRPVRGWPGPLLPLAKHLELPMLLGGIGLSTLREEVAHAAFCVGGRFSRGQPCWGWTASCCSRVPASCGSLGAGLDLGPRQLRGPPPCFLHRDVIRLWTTRCASSRSGHLHIRFPTNMPSTPCQRSAVVAAGVGQAIVCKKVAKMIQMCHDTLDEAKRLVIVHTGRRSGSGPHAAATCHSPPSAWSHVGA